MRNSWGKTKPPMGVQIDWTHPLARGLVSCWLFNQSADVVTGRLDIATTGVDFSMDGVVTNASSDIITLPTPVADIGNFSCFQIARWGNGLPGFLDLLSVTASGWHVVVEKRGSPATGAAAIYWITGSSSIAEDSLLVGDEFQNFTFISSGATQRLWINNAQRITTSVACSGSITGLRVNSRLGASTRGLNGTTKCTFVWARSLSPSEIMWLNAEPYAFMQQPMPYRRYFVPYVDTPATGQPLIMRTSTIPHLGGSLRQSRF